MMMYAVCIFSYPPSQSIKNLRKGFRRLIQQNFLPIICVFMVSEMYLDVLLALLN